MKSKLLFVLLLPLLLINVTGCGYYEKYIALERDYKKLQGEYNNLNQFEKDTFQTVGNTSVLRKFVMVQVIPTNKGILDRLGTVLIKDGDTYRTIDKSFLKEANAPKLTNFDDPNYIEEVEELGGSLSTLFGIANVGIDANQGNEYKQTFEIVQKKGANIMINDLDEDKIDSFCRRSKNNAYLITGTTPISVRTSRYKRVATGAKITAPAFSFGGQIYSKESQSAHSTYNGVLFTKCEDIIAVLSTPSQRAGKDIEEPENKSVTFVNGVMGLRTATFESSELQKIRDSYMPK